MWPLVLLLASDPVWIAPSGTPSSISACIPANEYVQKEVRTATQAERQAVFAERLLLDGSAAEERADRLEDENKGLRESNEVLVVWIVAVAAAAVFAGVGGVVLW